MIKRSRDVSDKNAAGIEFLFKKNKVDYIRGEASLDKAGEVAVQLADGKTETHTRAKILVATGVVSRPLPGLPFNGKTVIGSREAMILEPQPKSMVIIGAGAIGVEFAYFYNAFGTKVTLIEMLPNVLPVEDTEVSQTLEKALTKQGIKILTEHEDHEDRDDQTRGPGHGRRQIVGNDRSRCLPRRDRGRAALARAES